MQRSVQQSSRSHFLPIIFVGLTCFSVYSYQDSKNWLNIVKNARPIEEHPNYSIPTASQGFLAPDDTFSESEQQITLSATPKTDGTVFKAKGRALLPSEDTHPFQSIYDKNSAARGIFYELIVNRHYRESRTTTNTKEDGTKETKTVEENRSEEIVRIQAAKRFELTPLDEMSSSNNLQNVSYDPSSQTKTPKQNLSKWNTLYHQMRFATTPIAEIIPKEALSKENFISNFGPVFFEKWYSRPVMYSFSTNHFTVTERIIPEGTPITIYTKELNSLKQIQNPMLIADTEDENSLISKFELRKKLSLGATTVFSGLSLYTLAKYFKP